MDIKCIMAVLLLQAIALSTAAENDGSRKEDGVGDLASTVELEDEYNAENDGSWNEEDQIGLASTVELEKEHYDEQESIMRDPHDPSRRRRRRYGHGHENYRRRS